MKIAFYINDILYNTGGTETYTIRLCYVLQSIYPEAEFYFVTECYDSKDSISDSDFVDLINSRCGTKIQKENVHVSLVAASQKSWLSRLILRKKLESSSRKYDLFFYCSRGHYIFGGKKNIAIIHFPMERLETIKKDKDSLTRFRVALKSRKYAEKYDLFLPNSKFTQGFLKKIWPDIGSKGDSVLYPPVEQIPLSGEEKRNQIFVCSRIEKSKKLEFLIDAYKSSDYIKSNFRLVIAGGLPKDQLKYGEELKEYASGADIEFITNAPFSKIIELYNQSKIFWHSKGVDADEEKDPFLCEHFGISTVEAMSAGCVPIVINKGGQKEIVLENCGFRWNTKEQLVEYTEKLAKDENLQKSMSKASIERSKDFNLESFRNNLVTILEKLGL